MSDKTTQAESAIREAQLVARMRAMTDDQFWRFVRMASADLERMLDPPSPRRGATHEA